MLKHTHYRSQPIWIGLAIISFLTASTASARQQLRGHIPQEIATSPLLGTMEPTETLNLSIGLPMQNTEEMNELLKDLYDPHSSLYRHFLSSDEITARFGPSPSDYQAVIDFAVANHLTVTHTYANRLLVNVTGTVDDIQKTFHVHLNRYQRREGGEFHAPDQEPSVDLDVPLTHISGLENYAIPKPSFKKYDQLNSYANPLSGTGPGGSYFGSDFRNSYVPCLSSAVYGAGQTVAVIEFSTYLTSDINKYLTSASFSSPNPNPIGVNGYSTSSAPLTAYGNPPADLSWEVCLDIDMVLCMAPSCQVNVYEEDIGGNGSDILNQIASDNTAKVISCSWTDFTSGDVSSYFNTYALHGQSFFQAAGDQGAYVSGDPVTAVPNPIDITSEMTVVGGTQLTTGGSPITYVSETTWNDSAGAGSGGICGVNSTPVPIPTYQYSIRGINGASSTYRNIPDVSMIAQNIIIYADSSVTTVDLDGTSAAAPLWAGFTALINEQAGGPVGFINPALYFLAQNFYSNDFNDITTGNNNTSGSSSTLYSAGTGYDLATGLGSPKCNLIADMINPPNTFTPTQTYTPTITPTPTISPTPTLTPTITATPAYPTTTASYAYPQPAHGGQVYLVYNSAVAQQVRINIYSINGQLVDSVMDNPQASNDNRILISLQGFVPGVYLYLIHGLSSGDVIAKGKFLVVP